MIRNTEGARIQNGYGLRFYKEVLSVLRADFFTAGLFFLLYMPFGGLQKELEAVLGHRVMPYWKAYLLGIPTLFLYPLVWTARIAEELKKKAIGLGIDGPYTSWRHMFGWNTLGILLFGPAVATHRFFDTLNKIEARLNEDEARPNEDQARRNKDA